MIDLLERAPDGWQTFEPPGHPASIHFYYGVQAGKTNTLPMGAYFAVVYSPNVYVGDESPLHPWHYSVFEVCEYQYRPDRPLERSYKAIGAKRHTLSRFEVAHFVTLWAKVRKGGKDE